MKKKRFASLLIAAPLALLAACSSTPGLVLEANWFSNTSTKIIPDDFEETLEYSVSFEKSESALNNPFYMEFPEGGSYKVKFSNGSVEGKKTYIYTTELNIKVVYHLGPDKAIASEDTITTRVEFLDVQNELKPLSSTREAHVTAPLYSPSTAPDTLEAAYGKFDYKTEIVYDHEEEEAKFTITNLASDATAATPESETIDFDGSGLFFDNEQLIPVLRAAELSSTMVIRTLDPTTRSMEKIAIKTGPTQTTLSNQPVKFNGTEKSEFDVIEIGISYDKQNSGQTQKFTLAKRTSHDSNAYRNVLLKCEAPVIYSHGTLIYRLTNANFYQ